VSNATRGRLAEFIVAHGLGIATSAGIRDEWAAFDLVTPAGVKVEVKSAAFVQSWHQERLSPISFRTPATLAWDPETNQHNHEARRQADVYGFALLSHTDKATIDPLNVDQWRFFVLPTSVLNARARSQHSITLRSLKTLCGQPIEFARLGSAVTDAASTGSLPNTALHPTGGGDLERAGG